MTGRRESQDSIGRWRLDAFGPSASMFSMIVRTKGEVHELLEEVDRCAPACGDGVFDEMADVAICLYSVAAEAGGDLDASAGTLEDLFRVETDPVHLVTDVDANLSNALRWAAFAPDRPMSVMRGVTFAMAALQRIASLYGEDLHARVDAKMAVNRKREWRPDGRGHGQHVDRGSE